MHLKNIPIQRIVPNERDPRGIDIVHDDAKLEALQDSIRRFGIMVPIVVTWRNGRYFLIDGERRFRAAKMVGLTELPAYIIDPKDGDRMKDSELLYRMFQIHHLREPWGPVQQCHALEKVYRRIAARKELQDPATPREQLQRTVELLAADTGIDERTAADRVKFLRWPEKFKERMYGSPDEPGYSYVLEIEDKMIIPALTNYPEYFDHVKVDDVRFDLFEKLERGLGRATEVRRVAPYFRETLKKASDRKQLLGVLRELQRRKDMTYEEAQAELERDFPNLLRPLPPSPRKLLGQVEALTRSIEQFDISAFATAKGKGRASFDSLRAATEALDEALRDLRRRAKEDRLWT